MLTAIWLTIQFLAVGVLVWAGPQLSSDAAGALLPALIGALILVPLAPSARASLRSALAAPADGPDDLPARILPRPFATGSALPEAPGAPGSIRVRAPAGLRSA